MYCYHFAEKQLYVRCDSIQRYSVPLLVNLRCGTLTLDTSTGSQKLTELHIVLFTFRKRKSRLVS